MVSGAVIATIYSLINSYKEKHSPSRPTSSLPDKRLLACPNYEKYAKQNLTKTHTVEDWGEIYKREKQDKTSGEKYALNVLYMSPQRAALYEIFFNIKRQQWERNGQALPEGMYNIVITKEWKMLAFNDDDEELFNAVINQKKLSSKVFLKHISLASGECAFFAGMASLEKGRFTWNGRSGHFRPKEIHVSLCKKWLKCHRVTDAIYIKHEKEKIRERL
jgi:hypothetical protein